MTPRQAAAFARLSSFVEARSKMLGLDPEYVYSIHVDPNSDRSEHVRMSDLRTLLAMVCTPTLPNNDHRPHPQTLPLDRPRYLQETPDGWQGADHPDGPWRPIPGPQTQPPFSVGAEASEPSPTIRYEFEVTDKHDLMTVVSGDAATLEEAEREGRRYLAQYGKDGPCALELRRVEVLEVSSPEPAPAAAQPPLWRVMRRAYLNAPSPERGYAAKILAVRDRVVPEEAPPVAPTDSPAWLHWQQRQAIRALLTAEAARAEAGE